MYVRASVDLLTLIISLYMSIIYTVVHFAFLRICFTMLYSVEQCINYLGSRLIPMHVHNLLHLITIYYNILLQYIITIYHYNILLQYITACTILTLAITKNRNKLWRTLCLETHFLILISYLVALAVERPTQWWKPLNR